MLEGTTGRAQQINPLFGPGAASHRHCCLFSSSSLPLPSLCSHNFASEISCRFLGILFFLCLLRRRPRRRRVIGERLENEDGGRLRRPAEAIFDAWRRRGPRDWQRRRVAEPPETQRRSGIGHDEVPKAEPGLPPPRQRRQRRRAPEAGVQILLHQRRRRPGRGHGRLPPRLVPRGLPARVQAAARPRAAAGASFFGDGRPEPSARARAPPHLRLLRHCLPELHRRRRRRCRRRRAAAVGAQQAVALPARLGHCRAVRAAPAVCHRRRRGQDPAARVGARGEAHAASADRRQFLHARVQPAVGVLLPVPRLRRRRRKQPPPAPPPPQVRRGAIVNEAVVAGQGAQVLRHGRHPAHGIQELSPPARLAVDQQRRRHRGREAGRGAVRAAADLHLAVAKGEGGRLPCDEGHQVAPAAQEEGQERGQDPPICLPGDVVVRFDERPVRGAGEEMREEEENRAERDGEHGQRLGVTSWDCQMRLQKGAISALFTWLISHNFSTNEQYFSLTTNQSTVVSAITYQANE